MNVSDYVRRSILERARMPIVDPQDMQDEIERLKAHVAGAEAVIGLGKVWWLTGATDGVAKEALLEAIGAYDPATWQT